LAAAASDARRVMPGVRRLRVANGGLPALSCGSPTSPCAGART
jgi:hypothetical protein